MTFNFQKHKDELLFVPLGGSNEIGMNLNLYTIGGKWLMVDCGIGFAGDALPGVEIIVPDISFIMEHKENLLGLVITHAHEDHLGADHLEVRQRIANGAPVELNGLFGG